VDRLDPQAHQTPDPLINAPGSGVMGPGGPTGPIDPALRRDMAERTEPDEPQGTTYVSGNAQGETDPWTGSIVPGDPVDPWRYRDDVALAGADLTGYKVEATDGGIGKVDEASHEINMAWLVVDTGPWIFGKKVLLPAGTVNHVDRDERKVYVDRSKEQIKSAPEFDSDTYRDPTYRDKIAGYYGYTNDQ